MLVSLGDSELDVATCPVILTPVGHPYGAAAAPATPDEPADLDAEAAAGLVAAAKRASALGADVVEVHASTPPAALRALDALGSPWIAAVADVTTARHMIERGAAALRWTASGPVPEALTGDERGVPVIAASGEAGPRTWPVIDLAQPRPAPAGSVQVVDLGEATDRGEVATLVTLALEAGASVIRTIEPHAARRAAYVIRAIEAAR